MLGKIEDRRRRGGQRMRCLDGITESMDMNMSRLREVVKALGGAGVQQSMGLQRVRQDWMRTTLPKAAVHYHNFASENHHSFLPVCAMFSQLSAEFQG